MKFSYNWLQSFFDKKLPAPEKLADILTLRFFEIESIKKKGKDKLIDISILPNRSGDCLCHLGVARELSAILDLKIKEPVIKLKESNKKSVSHVSLDIKNDCTRYTAAVISDIKIGLTPSWIKERIENAGIQSINNVVDIANYVMLEMGQPLHVFDLDKINPLKKIIVRRAKKGEKITTLDNKELNLDKNILVIADDSDVLAIAGIKGGKKAEVDKNTKNILLESANFTRQTIRRGSAQLKLRTDASARFENGMDPNLTEIAIKRAMSLIQEIAGGKIAKGLIDFYPKKNNPKIIDLSILKTESILGKKISQKEILSTLSKLGFKIKNKSEDKIKIESPTRRVDVLIEEDLIEEIGRLHGYENIEAKLPSLEMISPKRNIEYLLENNIKNNLYSVGFTEVYNYTCISEEQFINFNYPVSETIEVESPVSLEQKYLRPELTPHIIKNIKDNEKYFSDIKIFELGKTFRKNNNKIEEKKSLIGAITNGSFYDVKGVVESIFENLKIEKIQFVPEKDISYLHSTKKASLIYNKEKIGFIGEMSSFFLKDARINSKVSIFVLDFEKIKEISIENKEYQLIAKFPEVTRDLSILVPEKNLYQEIIDTIENLKISPLRGIKLFDLYQGKEIPLGKKNVAIRLIFQGNKTLTTEEVNSFQDKIIESIEKNKNWKIRK